jgi:hypothetical protein
VLRRIFGPERDDVTRGWRILYNEELLCLYFSPYIIRMIKSRRMRWTGHVARMGEMRNNTKFWFKGGKPLGRPRRRGADNIEMDIWEIVFGVVV